MDIADILIGVMVAVGLLFFGYWILRFFKGNLKIDLQKAEFTEGETMKGTLHIKTKKSLQAQAITVGITAVTRQVMYGSHSHTRRNHDHVVFEHDIKQEVTLQQGMNDMAFSVVIPKGTTTGAGMTTGNKLLDGTIHALSGTKTRWYAHARVNCKGIDLYTKTPIILKPTEQPLPSNSTV